MQQKVKKRIRAVSSSGNGIGQVRYKLFRQVFSRINAAQQQGFYLEAITLVESLVTDRLEGRLSFVLGEDFSFKTLGAVIKTANTHEADDVMKSIISGRLETWRISRNKALHEMAKLAAGDSRTWEDRTMGLIPVCNEGISILREIDKRCKQLRKLEKRAR